MKPSEILAILSAANVTVFASGGRLRYLAGPGEYTDSLKKLVADNRIALVARLQGLSSQGTLSASKLSPCNPCICGSTEVAGFPIHSGKSVRCDCAKCGRFISFPVWYGKRMKDIK
jgi:hypothetical protein